MQVKKLLWPALALLILLLLVLAMAGVFRDKIQAGVTAFDKIDPQQGYLVSEQLVQNYEIVPATINAKQATSISARILAKITKIHVRAGEKVKKGQLLIELEQSDLQSMVSQSSANMQSVNARLTEAKRTLKRSEDLYVKGVFSQSDLDKATAANDALMADFSAAQQSHKQAETLLEYSRIRAPINGIMIDRFAEPGDTAQPGVTLLSLYNPDSLRIEANVREVLALQLGLQQSLMVEVPSIKRIVPAEIEEIVPAGNPGSRSFQVKARLQSQQGLLPGMYAKMQIATEEKPKIMIPSEYTAELGQLDLVWVNEQGNIQKRFVRIGNRSAEQVEIISGLKSGERLLLPKNHHREVK